MYFALIVICQASVVPCNTMTAAWAEQSDPVFPTEADCLIAAGEHVEKVAIPSLPRGIDYRVNVTCDRGSI